MAVAVAVWACCLYFYDRNVEVRGDEQNSAQHADIYVVPASKSSDATGPASSPAFTATSTSTDKPGSKSPPDQPYGEMIQSILLAKDGKRALMAIQKLDWCAEIDSHVELAFKRKDNLSDPRMRSAYAKIAESLQDDQRSCQSITPELRSSRFELLKMANSEGAFGAGVKYLTHAGVSAQSDRDAWKLAVANAITDSRSGDKNSIQLLAIDGGALDLPKELQWAYATAAAQIQKSESTGNATVDWVLSEGFILAEVPPGTPQDVIDRVNVEAQKIVDAYQNRRKNKAKPN